MDVGVDSQNGCHHFQWWFRGRIGTTPDPGHVDSALLEVVAPMKGCRSRALHCSRCVLVRASAQRPFPATSTPHGRGLETSESKADIIRSLDFVQGHP